MYILSDTATALAHSFSYALLSSLWQGGLVFGLLYIVLNLFRTLSASAKHFLSYSASISVFAWFLSTWQFRYELLKGATVYITGSVGGATTASAGAQQAVTAMPAHFFGFPQIAGYVPLIVSLYCIGLGVMLLRFLINVVRLRSLSRNVIAVPGIEWSNFLAKWQYRFGISRNVGLFLSRRVDVPMMLGVFKPVILLPVATINRLTTEQVESIILHELAHIKRHDYLLNMLQTIVETILFFNPFIWLISAIVRKEREHCCDDLVVASSSDAVVYANALALLEDSRIANSLSLAATGHKNHLLNRIKRIVDMKNGKNTHGRFSALIVAIVAATFLTAMIAFTPSFAQRVKTEKVKEKTTVKKGVTTTKTVTVDDRGKKKVVTKSISSIGGTAHDDDEEGVSINISVSDDDDNPHAKVTVISSTDDKGGKGKRVRKEVVISSADGRGHTKRDVEREIEKAQRELSEVDWEEIGDGLGTEIAQAITEVIEELDFDQLGKQINVEVRKSLAEAKRDIAESKKEIIVAKRQMADAKREMDNAGERTQERESMETMLDDMDANGLIDRNHKFNVEKDGGVLYINGRKQSKAVLSKYSKYLSDNHISITGKKGSLNVLIIGD